MREVRDSRSMERERERGSSRLALAAAIGPCAALLLLAACTDGVSTDPGGTSAQCGTGTVYDPNSGTCVVGGDGFIGGFDSSTLDAGGSDAIASADGGGVAEAGSTDAADTTTTEDTATGKDAVANKSWWQDCPPSLVNPDGAKHGKACAQDSECLYNHCIFGAPLAGYNPQVGVCSKRCNACSSGAPVSACDVDNGAGAEYRCVYEKQQGNPLYVEPAEEANGKVIMCGRACKCSGTLCTADPACIAWNPDLPDCIGTSSKSLSVNPNGTCGKSIGD